MDIRGSIFRITESGVASANGGFVDFDDLGFGPDEPLIYDTGCHNTEPGWCPNQLSIKEGEIGTWDPANQYSTYQCSWPSPLGYRAFAHLAPHSDTGFHDGFFSVMVNASEPDGIRRLARFHSPVECTGTGQGLQDAVDLGTVGGAIGGAALSDATMDWINAHAVYCLYYDGTTWGGHVSKYDTTQQPSNSTCFQHHNFKEYQYPFSLNELHPWSTAEANSTISGWVNPCEDINLALENLPMDLEYVPVSIKFKNLSDLPTFFSVSACLNGLDGFGQGFGATDPNATGAFGNKGEYDFEERLYNEFTCNGQVMFDTLCQSAGAPAYPHVSGFVAPNSISCEYLMDSAFDYFVVQVVRINTESYANAYDYCSSNMVQDMWIVSQNGLAASARDVWVNGFPSSGLLEMADASQYMEPYGKLPHYSDGPTSSATPHDMHPRWHDLGWDGNLGGGGGGMLVTYSEPKTKIDTITPPPINSAVIPSVGDGTISPIMYAAPINADIHFGPYVGNHFLFDLVSGVVCTERGSIDFQGSNQWEYEYEFTSPFNNGTLTTYPNQDFYGGFVPNSPMNHEDWVIRVGSPCYAKPSYPESWESGFNIGASGWDTAPASRLFPQGNNLYLTTQRTLSAGIQAVHDIRDYLYPEFNVNGNGPFIRESLFEMALQTGTSIAGYIEGLQTTELGASYDTAIGTPPNNPLDQYWNVFQSEPVVIDVYRVDKTLTLGTY